MEGVLLGVAALLTLTGLLLFVRARQDVGRARSVAVDIARSGEQLGERLAAAEDDRREMELVLSTMKEGVVLVSADGNVSFTNPAADRHLLGKPASLSSILPLGLQEAVRSAAEGQFSTLADVETGAPSRWLRASAIPVGEEGSVLLVITDVTESKRLEAVRRDFVANASHELKTPVSSIRAAAETIRTAAAEDPTVAVRFAEQLEREALRLSRIVADLLDLSRLEAGSELGESVALDSLLREEGERLGSAAAGAGVALEIDAEAAPLVHGSARDLSLLVRNLVDNAIRYTKPGGRVNVGLEAGDGVVVLTVADTGIGIPTRDLPRVFERFYRVDRARSRETGGTGLGLSIVKHVAENHGGTVSVESELGRGSTFTVRLPASP